MLFAHRPACWWQGEAGDRARLPQEVLQWVAALRSFSFGEEQGKSRKQGQGLCPSLSFIVISSLLLGTEIQHREGGAGVELERSSLPCSCSSGPQLSISPALEGLLLLGVMATGTAGSCLGKEPKFWGTTKDPDSICSIAPAGGRISVAVTMDICWASQLSALIFCRRCPHFFFLIFNFFFSLLKEKSLNGFFLSCRCPAADDRPGLHRGGQHGVTPDLS